MSNSFNLYQQEGKAGEEEQLAIWRPPPGDGREMPVI
jgi:hypothetical protein